MEEGGKMYEWIEGKGRGLEGVMNERVEERKWSTLPDWTAAKMGLLSINPWTISGLIE